MTRRVWDFKAAIHDGIFSLPVLKGLKSSEVENYLLLLENIGPVDRALDIGCGTGEYMALQVSNANRFGVDLSIKMLKRAGQKVDGIFLCSTAGVLPFKSKSFRFVSAIGLLEYFRDKKTIITEMERVLKPGGWAIASFTHKSAFNIFRRLWGVRFYTCESDDIMALFRESGFEVVDHKKSLIQTQVLLKKIK